MSEESAIGKTLVVKLITGEEIIGKVVDLKQGAIALENVFGIGYQQSQEGRIGFGFMPYSPLSVDPKFINMNHIIFACEPKEGLQQAYNQQTGAIITPNKSIITG